MTPKRLQLHRTKGWRTPVRTIQVDRSTKWGNPFKVGVYGTREQCVDLFAKMLAGDFCLTTDNIDQQEPYREMALRDRAELAGKNLVDRK